MSTHPWNERTAEIFGFDVAVGDVPSMSAFLAERARTIDAPMLVAAADVHVITRGTGNPSFEDALLAMDVICPDGMPIVWLLNKNLGATADAPTARRISGPDLMHAMLREPAKDGEPLRHFLLGGSKQLLEKLTANIAELAPHAHIAGTYAPPFRDWTADDLGAMRDAIFRSNANVVWVGLGCPKQERWMAANRDLLPAGVYLGVGAAFAFHAGTVKRAPLWMQRHGLEWFYRLCREPRRLFARYFTYNSKFLWYLVTGKKRSKHAGKRK